MSNQPLGFSRVTAHDVISFTSMKLHIFDRSLQYLCIHACVLLIPPLPHCFTGNRHRERPEPNNLLHYHSRLAGYKKPEPNTNPYSSGPSLALDKHPEKF